MNLKKYLFCIVGFFILSTATLNASNPLKTNWMPLMLDGITSVIPFKKLVQTPTLTVTPNTVTENSVPIEINGSSGFKVFIDGVYVGTIGSDGKLAVTLNVPGKNGLKHFSIYFEDADGYTSDTLTLNIQKRIPETTPPLIQAITPAIGSIINDKSTELSYTVVDADSDIDLSSLSVTINGKDATSISHFMIDNGERHLVITPSDNFLLPVGTIEVKITVADILGNQAIQTFQYYIPEETILSATPIASPKTAYAPATIRFSPQVTTDNAIQRYYWDFDGDGTYDRNDITANSYTWQYTTPGDYNVTLKVVDVNNEVIIGSTIVHILNTPPNVTVESTPSNGAIPLTVNFAVTANDSDGIALYEWDFDGDGVYDYNSTTSGNTSYTYTVEGIFNAQLRVTDNRGATALYTAPTTKVLASSQGSPSVTASGSPLAGNAPLNVSFSATATDPQDKGFALYEWDFDGDGVYDYNSSTSANTSFTYDEAGVFYPRVRVTTTDGRTTYDALEVIANQAVTLSIMKDTIDILQSQTATIHTTTTAKSPMKVVVEDRDHNVIKIVQDWTVRESGSYDDVWDGTDANGNPVKEGDYYAVLLYKVGNEVKRLDLRDSSGGNRYNPYRTENPRSFAPYDNRPMKINFTLPRPSEVVSFIGYDNTDTRIVTLRSREVLGKGTYTDSWNAINDEGVYIVPPPGRWFLYGIWAFTLADNAIYVNSGAHVSAITATPPIYTPDSHEEEGKQATMKIHFNLNKKANVEMEVYDATEGVLVATRTFANVPAGDQIVEFDGKDNNGVYLHPGKYSVGIRAVDENGYRSMMEYTITRIKY